MLSKGRNAVPQQTQPIGSMMSRPISNRSWLMFPDTGYVHNTATATAGWARGPLSRWGAPRLRPNGRNLYVYDPSNPLTWDNPA